MTKDELQGLLSKVYGADVESSSPYWNISIKTTPPREIIFTEHFVEEYVGQSGEGLDKLREMLLPIAGSRHVQDDESKELLFVERIISAKS